MSTTAASASTYSADFLAAQRRLLQSERATIEAGLATADGDLAEMRDRNVADVDFSEEGGEGSSTASERGHAELLKAQLTSRIGAVDAALARLESGGYGVCESCGGAIGEARLEAMPDTTECVACKSAPWTARRG